MVSIATTPAVIDTAWARGAFARVKAAHPTLTSYGFGLPPGCDDHWLEGLSDEHLKEIVRAARWLDGMDTVKRADRFRSYAMKHTAERWAGGYIREGSLIVAALALGVPVRPYGDGRHGVYLGLSARSVRGRTP
jgi:hypothetical protein